MIKFPEIKNIALGLLLGILITLFVTRDKDIQINNYGVIDSVGIWHFDGGFRDFEEYTNGEFVEIFNKRDYALEILKSDKMQRIEIDDKVDEELQISSDDNLCNQARDAGGGFRLLGEYKDFSYEEFFFYQDIDQLREFLSDDDLIEGKNYFYIYKSLLGLGHYYDTLYQTKLQISEGEPPKCYIYLKIEDLNFLNYIYE